MRFPSVAKVAEALRHVNESVDGECDVRLQVYPDGDWQVNFGDSSYDQDHRGYWGSGCVPGLNAEGHVTRFRSKEVAKDLIEQCKEHYEQSRNRGASRPVRESRAH